MNVAKNTAGQKDMDAIRSVLAGQIYRWTEKEHRLETEVPGLILFRHEQPTDPVSVMHEPSVCLIAQGSKRVMLGDEEYVYDANNYLLTSVGLPVISTITEASPEEPFLGLVLRIELRVVTQMMVDSNLPMPGTRKAGRGLVVSGVCSPLLDAFQRLVGLLDQPEGIPILAPLIQKEILYRLLVGGQGPRLRQIASAGSHGHQVAYAIEWMKKNYSSQFKVEGLARQAGMSTSTFHHHFRAMTAMSPLQFQKWLRLQEARRLMLAENCDAASAALEVGYESPSQFSREYKRQFGAPPLRDIKNLSRMGKGGNLAESFRGMRTTTKN